VPQRYWKVIDKDISNWDRSPELATPRDFWNGFHGICMGFKLKIGLIYFVTAENVFWERKKVVLNDLWFGVDLQQTRVVEEGVLPASRVIEFYNHPQNEKIRRELLAFTIKLSSKTSPRDKHPIIVVQKEKDGGLIFSTYDGNRRLAKAILEGNERIDAYIGSFTYGTKPKNFWIPTTVLMENLYFARLAYERSDKKVFRKYMGILKDMINQSESAKYELENRALTSKQPFRDEVLKSLDLLSL